MKHSSIDQSTPTTKKRIKSIVQNNNVYNAGVYKIYCAKQ